MQGIFTAPMRHARIILTFVVLVSLTAFFGCSETRRDDAVSNLKPSNASSSQQRTGPDDTHAAPAMDSDETEATPLTPKDMTPVQKLAALPQPSVDLSPRQVIELQVAALGDNDKPFKDAGIYTAFNFASPANKRVTGPIERFVTMVKNPIYRDMLDFEKAVFGPLEQTEGRAMQIVVLYQRTEQGLEPAVYGFTISKQIEGPQESMWVTDSVIRMKPEVLEEIDPQRSGDAV